MRLVKNGKSCCALAFAAESRFAAEECQKYIRKITGASLPLVPDSRAPSGVTVYIGDAKSAALRGLRIGRLPPQGYHIRMQQDSGWIIGATKLATLHGVYAFLEQCGCHWAAPGKQGETIRQTPSLDAAADTVSAPDLPLRGMHLGGRLWTGGKDVEQLDWMARNRMNFCAMGEIDYWPEYKEHALREIKHKRGMTMMVGCHTWTHLLHPDRYFKKHPEYYALVAGQRRNPLHCSIGGGNAMLCTTHPDVPKIMAENVIMFLSQNPEIDIMGLSQNDGHGWCECPRCARLEPFREARLSRRSQVATKRNLYLINKIVERVARVFPEKRFAAMAYAQTLEPPDEPEFRLHPNLDLIVALFERMYDRPLNKGLTPNDWKTMSLDFNPIDVRYTYYPELLRRWRRIVQGRIYCHKYYMAHNACRCLPFPIHTILVEDLKFFKSIGLDGFYAQYPTWPMFGHDYPDNMAGNFGVYGLNYYLAARAGYDTGAKTDQLISQYCRHYYGQAAKPMAAYYRMLDQAGRNTHFSANANELIQIFTPAVIESGRSLLNRAAQMAPDRRAAARIRQVACSFRYASAMAAIRNDMLAILRDYLPGSRINAVVRLMKRLKQRETRLVRFIKRNMAGKGLFYWVKDPTKPMVVNADFISSIKSGVFKIRAPASKMR